MHDIAERFEVGTLSISCGTAPRKGVETAELPRGFKHIRKLELLEVVERSHIDATIAVITEAGLAATAETGDTLIIVASVAPYNVEISASFLDDDCQSQYLLDAYRRVAVPF
jgi:hypothetical protein